jgi:hypothetical protein
LHFEGMTTRSQTRFTSLFEPVVGQNLGVHEDPVESVRAYHQRTRHGVRGDAAGPDTLHLEQLAAGRGLCRCTHARRTRHTPLRQRPDGQRLVGFEAEAVDRFVGLLAVSTRQEAPCPPA